MREGHDLALIPGGFEEASIHSMGEDRVFLKNRMGFVKYALQYGYSLTPVYAFGERRTFYNAQGAWALREWLNGFGLPAILPFGRWWCPILPLPVGLHVVVGTPIRPSWGGGCVEKPTREQVAKFHAEYVAAIKSLYKRHAPDLAAPNQDELSVW